MIDRNIFLLTCCTTAGICFFSRWIINKQDKQIKAFMTQSKLNCKIIQLFCDYSDPAILERVRSEVEFDWVVKDLG